MGQNEEISSDRLPTCLLINYPLPESWERVDLYQMMAESQAVDIVGPDIKYLRTQEHPGSRYHEVKGIIEQYKFMKGT